MAEHPGNTAGKRKKSVSPSTGNTLKKLALLTGILLISGGCMFSRATDPARTGIEQLLLSTAADRAMANVKLDALKGRRVFLDTSNFESYDKGYAISLIKNKLNKSGARMTDDKKKADVIVEARCGALSIDRSDSLIGLPSFNIPIPMAGVVKTPEIALFKKIDQESVAKLALFAYDKKSGANILSTKALMGKSYYNRWWILIVISFRTTDIPEKVR